MMRICRLMSESFSLVIMVLIIFTGCERIESLRNNPPKINILNVPNIVHYGETVDFKVSVFDPEDDEITYFWTVSDGTLIGDSQADVKWTAPVIQDEKVAPPDTVNVHISVRDGGEEQTTESATISVISKAYQAANALKGVYELVQIQVNDETLEASSGTMRLTTSTYSRQIGEGGKISSGTYDLTDPFDHEKGTLIWYPDDSLQFSMSTYTWDGKLLIIYWEDTSTKHVYEKRG